MIKYITTIIKKAWSRFKTLKRYYLPGFVFFFLLFIAGNVLNFTLSYMGNTNEEVAMAILRAFWPVILWQLGKIVMVYLLAGGLLSALFRGALESLRNRFGLLRREGVLLAVQGMLLCLTVFLGFSYKLILNPQVYIENFSVHGKALAGYQVYLTDHLSPLAFALPFYGILGTAALLALLSLPWRKGSDLWMQMRQGRYFKGGLRAGAILALAFLLFAFLYEQKYILYNREARTPSILILSSDAVRPDHLSLNGYRRNTTPRLDAFFRDSLQVRGMITALPRTFPAWVSVLTSQYPLTHEIRHMFPRTRERNVTFDSAVKILAGRGYRTAVISDYAGDIFPRIDLGFQKILTPDFNFDVLIRQILLEKQAFLLPFLTNDLGTLLFPEMRGLAKYTRSQDVTGDTIREIEAARGNPFFLTVFYSITHFPYAAPYPYYKKYTRPGYDGPYRYYKQVVLKMDNMKGPVRGDTREDEEQVAALYDNCLSLLDGEMGRLLGYLEKKGLLENTIVLFTSDHGENFYEADLGMGHGEHLRGPFALEVPFLLRSGRLKEDLRKTFTKTSSSVDIMPTLFDLAGLPIPASFQGRSLLPALRAPGSAVPDVEAYCETGIWFDNNKESKLFFQHNRIDYPDISGISDVDMHYRREGVIRQNYQNIINASKYRAIYSGRYKLIYLPLPGGARYELYDYLNDPLNQKDLSASRRDVLEGMKKKFLRFVDEKGAGNFILKDGFLYPAFSDPMF